MRLDVVQKEDFRNVLKAAQIVTNAIPSDTSEKLESVSGAFYFKQKYIVKSTFYPFLRHKG